MAFKFKIWHEDPVIRVSVTGSPDYLSTDKLWHDIVTACKDHNCLKVLGESATEDWQDADAYDHAAIFEAAGLSNLYRVAWVENNSGAREKVKLAEAVVNNRDVVTSRLFDTLAEARRWLDQDS